MDESVRRRLAVVVASAAVLLGLLLAVWAAASGPALDWSVNDGSGEVGVGRSDAGQQAEPGCPVGDPRCEPVEEDEPEDISTLVNIVLAVLGALLLVGVIALLRAGAIARLARRRSAALRPPGEPLPDVAAAVHEDAKQQRDTLRAGTPRNAIVACWVRLEDSVASAGTTVRGSETSSELTARVLARYGVDGEAIRTLASLYREARFSRHEITEVMRESALDALDRVHGSLRLRTVTVEIRDDRR